MTAPKVILSGYEKEWLVLSIRRYYQDNQVPGTQTKLEAADWPLHTGAWKFWMTAEKKGEFRG